VGPTLAFWLAAAGFKPTLVARARPESPDGRLRGRLLGLDYEIAERMGSGAASRRQATTSSSFA
jgi:hypothetical protein